jgi:hypothetical protein
MTITTAVVRAACRATNGTQNFTSSGFGTAKACIVIITTAITDGTAAADNVFGLGFATGTTNRFCLAPADKDNVATQDCTRVIHNDSVAAIYSAGTTTLLAQGDFNAFVTDGIQIDWTTVSGSQELVTVILFGGDDLSAHANSITWGDTIDEAIDVTAPAFEPDIVFMIGSRDLTAFNTAGGGDTEASFGVCHNDGASGITQRAIGMRYDNGVATSIVELEYSTDATLVFSNNEAHDWEVDLTTFDANGFTANARDAGGNLSNCAYLALKFANHSSWVGTHSTPTSSGDKADTGPGFKPQLAILGNSLAEAANTLYLDSHATTVGLSAFDGTNEFCTTVSSEDNVGTTNTQSLSDNTAVNVPDNAGSALLTAAFTSFDATGFTLNYSAFDAAARLFFGFAVETSVSITVEQEGYRWRNDDGSESAATWRQSQDVADTAAREETVRLRTLLNATGDPAAGTYQVEVKKSTDGDSEYKRIPL